MMALRQRRVLAGALLTAAAVGSALVAGGPAQAQPVTTGTVTFTSDRGDVIGRGQTNSYATSKGDLVAMSSKSSSTVTLTARAPNSQTWQQFEVTIDAPGVPGRPAAGHPVSLVPGTYPDAHRYPFNGMGPGLEVDAFGTGCNELTGSFTIIKAVFDAAGNVQTFDATFVQHCEGVAAALHGEIHLSNPAPPAEPTPSFTTTSPYAPPTATPGATHSASGPALAGGGAGTSPAVRNDAAHTRLVMIGWGVLISIGIAVAGLVAVGVVLGARTRALRRPTDLPVPGAAGAATLAGAAMGPVSTNDSAEHRWPRYDPGTPAARQAVPGKVIAVSIVLAVRGSLGLLLTFALIEVLRARAVPGSPVPSFYSDLLWLQLGMCAGEIVSGAFLWRAKAWPRLLGLSVLWFDIAAGTLVMLSASFNCGGLTGIAVDAVLIWMLCWPTVKDWCF